MQPHSGTDDQNSSTDGRDVPDHLPDEVAEDDPGVI